RAGVRGPTAAVPGSRPTPEIRGARRARRDAPRRGDRLERVAGAEQSSPAGAGAGGAEASGEKGRGERAPRCWPEAASATWAATGRASPDRGAEGHPSSGHRGASEADGDRSATPGRSGGRWGRRRNRRLRRWNGDGQGARDGTGSGEREVEGA